MNKIFNKSPLDEYENLTALYKQGDIRFKFGRQTANSYAIRSKKWLFFLMLMNYAVTIIVPLIISLASKVYWGLFFIPLNIILLIFIHRLAFIRYLSVAFLIVGLIIKINIWILSLPISIIIFSVGYFIWWEITSNTFHNILLSNKEIFEEEWNRRSFMIIDKYNNKYIREFTENELKDIQNYVPTL